MKINRRKFLKITLASITAGLSILETALAHAGWSAADFAPTTFDAAMKQLLKGKKAVETDKIVLTIPEIAENGALVPVTVTSTLEGINSFALLAELNPVPLAIQLHLTPDIEPFLSARLKLAETSYVYALAETDKGWFSVRKKVKVTIGGCGG
jgi:sulfur-oxidizing protein SoxY